MLATFGGYSESTLVFIVHNYLFLAFHYFTHVKFNKLCNKRKKLYINYQLDALIIIYSLNIIPLYMFRASSAHLQEDTVVYIQPMVLSLSTRVPGGLSADSLSEN